jgi:hypothetical protein
MAVETSNTTISIEVSITVEESRCVPLDSDTVQSGMRVAMLQ